MKAILTMLQTDARLVRKNIFFWVTIGFLILIVVSVNFLLPSGTVETDAAAGFPADALTITYLGPVSEPAPFNLRMVPLCICCEAVITGILLSGVLILSEKSEGIARAYRISPGTALEYVLAKTLLFSIIGSLYSLLIAVFTIGFTFNLLPFILLAFTASALFTLIGIAMTVFMRSVSNWLMVLAFVVGINMLAMFSYLFPAAAVDFLKILPAYPIFFAFDNILFGTQSLKGFGTIALWTAASLLLCLGCVKYRLLRPHKGE